VLGLIWRSMPRRPSAWGVSTLLAVALVITGVVLLIALWILTMASLKQLPGIDP
jgi:hypothetical protein